MNTSPLNIKMENFIESDKIDNLVEALTEYDHYHPGSLIVNLEGEYNCTISVSVEKHNQLQYTHYFEVDFNELNDGKEDNFSLLNIEIESGINNGTQINSIEWNLPSKPSYREVEVLDSIEIDENYYKTKKERQKAQAILDQYRDKIFKYNRENNYDNYVTGGNSQLKLDMPDIRLSYHYKTIKVDPNFI